MYPSANRGRLSDVTTCSREAFDWYPYKLPLLARLRFTTLLLITTTTKLSSTHYHHHFDSFELTNYALCQFFSDVL